MAAAAFRLQLLLFSCFFFVPCYSLSEAESLLKFKASLKNADKLKSWEKNPKPPCDDGRRGNWVGVLCNDSKVLGLMLEGMGLSGTINTDALSKLPNLKTLSFKNNKFQGPLPNFRKIRLLKALYLNKNQFSGDIPANAFEGLNRMMKLYLPDNKFTGPIPSSITPLPKLKELNLKGNRFSGRIPELKQKSLRKIEVTDNELQGPIPERYSKMNRTWFSGNKGLCGAPLKQCVSPTPSPSPAPSKSPQNDPDRNKSSSIWLLVIIFKIAAVLIFVVLLILLISRRRNHKPLQSVEAPPPPPASVHQDAAENLRLAFLRDDRERFDLKELLKSAAEVLGSGSFGSSYKAALPSGTMMVVKRHQTMNNAVKEEFHEHMKIIGRLRHDNVHPLIAYYYRKDEKLLVSDYIENGSLAVHLHGHQSLGLQALTWSTRLKIVKGVGRGLEHMYKSLPGLIAPHGHLKSSNVLLDDSLQPLLTDYGLIPVINQESAQELMIAYKSPEYVRNGRITRKTDVWSFGVLILEILTGIFPANFMGNDKGNEEQDLAFWVKSKLGNDLEHMSKIDEVFDNEMNPRDEKNEQAMVELLKIGLSCCEADVEKRLDLKTAVERIEELKG